jgi:hypothetical protein
VIFCLRFNLDTFAFKDAARSASGPFEVKNFGFTESIPQLFALAKRTCSGFPANCGSDVDGQASACRAGLQRERRQPGHSVVIAILADSHCSKSQHLCIERISAAAIYGNGDGHKQLRRNLDGDRRHNCKQRWVYGAGRQRWNPDHNHGYEYQ